MLAIAAPSSVTNTAGGGEPGKSWFPGLIGPGEVIPEIVTLS